MYMHFLFQYTVRPSMPETTALGAAMAAGHALGIWRLDADGAKVTTDTFTASITEKGIYSLLGDSFGYYNRDSFKT